MGSKRPKNFSDTSNLKSYRFASIVFEQIVYQIKSRMISLDGTHNHFDSCHNKLKCAANMRTGAGTFPGNMHGKHTHSDTFYESIFGFAVPPYR